MTWNLLCLFILPWCISPPNFASNRFMVWKKWANQFLLCFSKRERVKTVNWWPRCLALHCKATWSTYWDVINFINQGYKTNPTIIWIHGFKIFKQYCRHGINYNKQWLLNIAHCKNWDSKLQAYSYTNLWIHVFQVLGSIVPTIPSIIKLCQEGIVNCFLIFKLPYSLLQDFLLLLIWMLVNVMCL